MQISLGVNIVSTSRPSGGGGSGSPTVPAKVAGLTATPGDGEVTLAWAAPYNGGAAITDYIVQVDDGGGFSAIADGVSTATGHVVTGLSNGTVYGFRVRALNAEGTGPLSDPVEATPFVADVPDRVDTPEIVLAPDAVHLSWEEPFDGGSPITGYRIGRSVDGGANWTNIVVDSSPDTATTYIDTDVTPGIEHRYWIKAKNALGFSTQFSFAVAATPYGETHVVALVGQSNMQGSDVNTDGATWPDNVIQMNANTRALVEPAGNLNHPAGYNAGFTSLGLTFAEAYRAANPGARLLLVPGAVGGSGFDGGLTYKWNKGDTVYEDFIADINALFAANPDFVLKGILWQQGEADAQAGTAAANAYEAALDQMIADMRADIAVADATTPFAAGGLMDGLAGASATNRDTVHDTLANLPSRMSYTGFAPSTGLTSANRDTAQFGGGADDNVHFDCLSLRTMGTRQHTALTEAAANTAVPTVPGRVAGLTATAGDGEVVLDFVAPANGGSPITDYLIEVSIAGGAFSTVADGTSTATAYTHTGLANGTLHTYRVSAVNAVGTGEASLTASATPVAGVANLLTNGDFSSGFDGWTYGAGTPGTVSGGGFVVTAGGNIRQAGLTLAQGTTYRITFTRSNMTSGSNTPALLDATSSAVATGSPVLFSDGNGTFSQELTPSAAATQLQFGFGGGSNHTIDDVILEEV